MAGGRNDGRHPGSLHVHSSSNEMDGRGDEEQRPSQTPGHGSEDCLPRLLHCTELYRGAIPGCEYDSVILKAFCNKNKKHNNKLYYIHRIHELRF